MVGQFHKNSPNIKHLTNEKCILFELFLIPIGIEILSGAHLNFETLILQVTLKKLLCTHIAIIVKRIF